MSDINQQISDILNNRNSGGISKFRYESQCGTDIEEEELSSMKVELLLVVGKIAIDTITSLFSKKGK